MRITHRVGFGKFHAVDSTLDALEIKYRKTQLPEGYYVITFDIDEQDPRWPEVARLVREKHASDIFDTVFTAQEILDAEWVRLVPNFLRDYPQPEEGMAWTHITYENECPRCGVGYRQKAPFRLAKEPRLGKHDFWTFFWVYEVFCTPRVIEALRGSQFSGFEVWPALMHRSDQPSQLVSQLVFPTIAKPGLAKKDRQQPERCWRCGTTKYAFHMRGYMHLERKALRSDVDFQVTHEWFGSGSRSGHREILASNRVAKLILERKWRGLALKPVELV